MLPLSLQKRNRPQEGRWATGVATRTMGRETIVPVQRLAEYPFSPNTDTDLPRPTWQKTKKTPEISDDEDDDMNLQEPWNKSTMVYSWPEAVTILADATKPGTVANEIMIRAMTKKGCAPTSAHTLRRLSNDRADRKLILDIPWSGQEQNGRRSIQFWN